MHVSNFRPVKRIADVLAVFDRIRREVPARLLLIGDGPDRSLAERLAREGGFEDRTTFLGNVAAIETILPVARLMLLPSDAESFGLAALEAMACGVPVIGTAAGGLPEVVEDGVGRLSPAGRRRRGHGGRGARRSCAIRSLVGLLARARRRADESFPTGTIVSRYRELYEKTLGESVQAAAQILRDAEPSPLRRRAERRVPGVPREVRRLRGGQAELVAQELVLAPRRRREEERDRRPRASRARRRRAAASADAPPGVADRARAQVARRRDAEDRVLLGEPREQLRDRRPPRFRGRAGPGAARRAPRAPTPLRPTLRRAPTCCSPSARARR